ncbi:MAG: hypothetical protein ACD_30C00112G0021 [uncultured bacterium]|uniref:Enolase n=4 Tax=Candidatus Daviesiibacteriota TaxID=1752718 RepID=A0A0G0HEK9_9BACT|nr:MAG: hypothetical protein ACD_30C00112G0021 [uncultured bacterium]KKQ10559.1 MAG: Enolase [Candidatus Daviesbacteria bacterium GW2011_GWB1_36_5]KKQ15302.1 MAG: Enolase [Candidatus Daviesbacteria bacterium GW2011_GWA1_36_8]OGE17180.1 MAG: phosphopyruvate hydratase [Candidatus Daviesbacteria bacterium RIFCSPHIGHO2_01_FULL_36_37]OGE35961.1 MAG: phosphopyruvate hydratase [Candidatus Daviesbacteria bacterium RIFCSPHIGHO2_12_FULL_37_16]
MKIKRIHARQILDSRGNPTIESDVILEDGTIGRAAVPSGASTGKFEALELRDQDPKKFGGKSVLKAVENVNGQIDKLLNGFEVTNQQQIDQALIDLDGTENKSNLGANAILSVSLAVAYAAANFQKLPLFMYINSLAQKKVEPVLPLPMMNVMNGGRHANWATDIQEYMILPIGAQSISEAIQMGSEVFHSLGELLDEKGFSINVGDEGGYAPKVSGNEEPLEFISEAVKKAGFKLGEDIVFALDVAASEFFKDGKYILKAEGKELDTEQMIEWLKGLSQKYPIVSVEDGLNQEDWDGWVKLTSELGENIQIIGDDLFVTNIKFLEKGIKLKTANAILIKLNQIGTLTETIKAVEMAHNAGWKAIISHRSGETEDTTIAHLSVGLGTGQIKTGSLSRTDRIAKYNELLRIEELNSNYTKKGLKS